MRTKRSKIGLDLFIKILVIIAIVTQILIGGAFIYALYLLVIHFTGVGTGTEVGGGIQ